MKEVLLSEIRHICGSTTHIQNPYHTTTSCTVLQAETPRQEMTIGTIELISQPNTQPNTWLWGGQFHVVPNGFRFPKCKISDLYHVWWEGIAESGICPLRRLTTNDLFDRNDKANLSKAKMLMTRFIQPTGKTDVEFSKLCRRDRMAAFEPCLIALLELIHGDFDLNENIQRRVRETSYVTLYHAVKKKSV